MGREQEAWFQNTQLVAELYSDWIERMTTPSARPLSPDEWIGFRAIDYVVQMETGGIYGLVDPGSDSETYETVSAFETLGLDRYAKDLRQALEANKEWDDLEAALCEISSAFDGREEIEAAMFAYLRQRMS